MKKIPDDEWHRLFESHKRQREEADRQAFIQALSDDAPCAVPPDPAEEWDETGRVRLERRLPRMRPVPVDDALDLHMKRVAEARESVGAFLEQARQFGDRQVLIICGKGHHSEKGGVLQGHVRSWLKGPFARLIEWFSVAPRPMGGEGAFVVRIRNGNTTEPD